MGLKRISDALERIRRFLLRTADLWLAAGLIAGPVYFLSGYFTTVRFDRERIEVRVEPGQIHVTGLYHYANASRLPAILTLRNPFPTDSDHPQPAWFRLSQAAEDGQELTELPVAVRGDSASFRLVFRPGEEKWVRLDYDQPTRAASGRYLLVTTRAWRRPIGRGDYFLRLPPGIELGSSSYPLKPLPGTRGHNTYHFARTDFYPDQDWVFAWRPLSVKRRPPEGGYREKQSFGRLPAAVIPDGRSEASLRQ